MAFSELLDRVLNETPGAVAVTLMGLTASRSKRAKQQSKAR
jgi:hypothetical protein